MATIAIEAEFGDMIERRRSREVVIGRQDTWRGQSVDNRLNLPFLKSKQLPRRPDEQQTDQEQYYDVLGSILDGKADDESGDEEGAAREDRPLLSTSIDNRLRDARYQTEGRAPEQGQIQRPDDDLGSVSDNSDDTASPTEEGPLLPIQQVRPSSKMSRHYAHQHSKKHEQLWQQQLTSRSKPHTRSMSDNIRPPQGPGFVGAGKQKNRPRPLSFVATYREPARPRSRLASPRGRRSQNYVNFSRPLSQAPLRGIPGELLEKQIPPQGMNKPRVEVWDIHLPPPSSHTPDIAKPVVLKKRNSKKEPHPSQQRPSHTRFWSLPCVVLRLKKRRPSETQIRFIPSEKPEMRKVKSPLTETNLREFENHTGSLATTFGLDLVLPTPATTIPLEGDVDVRRLSPVTKELPTPPLSPGSGTAKSPFDIPPRISSKRLSAPLPPPKSPPDTPMKDQMRGPVSVVRKECFLRVCEVCKDSKPLSAFPIRKTTVACAHQPNTCAECIQAWVETCMDTRGFNACVCPECGESLSWEDVRCLATDDAFLRYDTLSTRTALSSIPNFHFCQRCPSGHIHDALTNPIFTCIACGNSHCINHPTVPNAQHNGLSCADLDRLLNPPVPSRPPPPTNRSPISPTRTPSRSPSLHIARVLHFQERRNEEKAREMSKRCPNALCGWWIEKSEGCDHMTCSQCKYEFCWLCGASFRKVKMMREKGHKVGCKYYE